MGKHRDTYKYIFKVDHEIVYRGVTNDLGRSEKEHKVRWPNGQIEQVGIKTTREQALAWTRQVKEKTKATS